MSQRDNLILDACVLLNLLATGVIENILKLSSQQSAICVLVEKESFYLRNETDVNESVSVDLNPLIESGLIEICYLENDDEQQMFVNLAAKLDDGEAMSLAIALSRNWHLATDDKKARRTFSENARSEQNLTSTLNLIKEWADEENIGIEEIKSILTKIETAARYRPAASDSNFQWWNSFFEVNND